MEHVRVAADSCTQIGVSSFLPFILEQVAVDVAETHSGHPTY